MTKIVASIEINAPVQEVFAFASDWRRWKDWLIGLSGFRPTVGITLGNGTRYAYRASILGLALDLETEIHDYEKNVGWRGVAISGISHSTQWVFEPEDGRTRLTHILEYDLPLQFLGALLDRFLMRPRWRRRLKESLGNLKRILESQKESKPAHENAAGI
ncbi:MAG: SRPBCC family protein [Acidobacteria bacterium]|nr:SRPBCC family protein [Acidobacteriota bacterium]